MSSLQRLRQYPISRTLRQTRAGEKLAKADAWRRATGREPLNPLLEYFEHNDSRLIHKWMHFFDIYHRHFAPFRGKDITLVEFGVSHGGSLQMWKNYFGPKARIIGVDIEPRCAALTEDQIEVVIGDQDDREFLASLRDRVGKIDVLIEDGGHTMSQMRATFDIMWPAIAQGGVYLAEDLHCCYRPNYGGGYKHEESFIEYAKDLIDQQNAWHSKDKANFNVDQFTKSITGIHTYDSIIVFDKGRVTKPYARRTGERSW